MARPLHVHIVRDPNATGGGKPLEIIDVNPNNTPQGNPHSNQAPQFLAGYSYPVALTPFGSGQGTYAEELTVGLDANNATELWVESINVYALPASGGGGTFPVGNTKGFQGRYSPNATGIYDFTVDSLLSDTAYDIWVTVRDFLGIESPALKVATTAAHPLELTKVDLNPIPANTTPVVSNSLTPVVIGQNIGATAYDLQFSFQLDNNGYQQYANGQQNQWIAQIDLLQSITGLNTWTTVNDIPIQATNLSTYTTIAAGVPLQNSYDFGIRYRDFLGNTSNITTFASNIQVGTLSIGNINQLPTLSAAQLAANIKLTLTASATTPTYVGMTSTVGKAGSYDAINIQFGIAETQFNSPWLRDLEYYAVANPNPLSPLTSYSTITDMVYLTPKGTRTINANGPSNTGSYQISVDGLSMGTSYSFYIAGKDAQGHTTAPRFLGITTPANIQTIDQTNLINGANGITPVVSTNGTPAPTLHSVNTSGVAIALLSNLSRFIPSSAIDLEVGINLDTNGRSSNVWLREISLMAAVTGTNKWAEYGKVSRNSNGVQIAIWAGLGAGMTYDFGVLYVDVAGNQSNVGLISGLQGVVLPAAQVTRTQFPANPTPSTAPVFASGYAYPLAVADFSSGSQGSYDAQVTFGLTITNPEWLNEVRIYAIPSGTTWVKNIGLKNSLPPNSTGVYTAVFDSLNGNQTYDLYVSFLDYQTIETSSALKIATTTAHPIIIGRSQNASMPSSPLPTPVVSNVSVPTVIGMNPGATAADLSYTFNLDSNGYSANPWLAEIEIQQSVHLQNNWSFATVVPIASSGSVAAIIPSVPLQNAFDFRVVYRDFNDTASQAATLASNVQVGTLSIPNVSQLPLNPSLGTPLTLSVSPTTPSYIGIGTAGAYDAINIQFTVSQTTANSPWLTGLRLYAIANEGTPGNATSVSGASFKGEYAPTSNGIYTIAYHGLSSGTAYGLYIAGVDGQGNVNAPRYLGITTPATVQTVTSINQATGAAGTTPSVTWTYSGSNAIQSGSGNSTVDLQIVNFQTDNNGKSTNTWLVDIELLAAIHNSGNYQHVGVIAKNSSGLYTAIWGGLGAGNTYDFAIRYKDYYGVYSNPSNVIYSVQVAIPNILPSQFPTNPSPSTAPVLASGYVAPLGVTPFAPASGVYDAEVNFAVTITNPVWLREIRTYVYPHSGTPAQTRSDYRTAANQKAPIAPNNSGSYTTIIDGLNAGTSYDIYITYADYQYIETPARFIATTATNPLIIGPSNIISMPGGTTPTVSSVVFVGYAAPVGSTTWDVQYSFTLDSNGYTTTNWLEEIELLASPHNAGNWQVYGSVIRLASGTYYAYWAGLGVGTNYDLAIRYVDYAGNVSNRAIVATNVGVGNLSIAATQLPANPAPGTQPTFASSPTSSGVTRGGVAATFDVNVSFALSNTTVNSLTSDGRNWLAGVRTYAGKNIVSGNDAGAANITAHSVLGGDKTLTLISEYSANSSGNYPNAIYELASGTRWDLYVALVDFQGIVSAPTYTGFTTLANPQIIGYGNQASGAVGVMPNAAATTVPNPGSSNKSTTDVAMSYYTDDIGTNDNSWLAEIQLIARINGSGNTWQQVGSQAPQSSTTSGHIPGTPTGEYSGIWAGLGANNIYDLSIRYMDYQGNLSTPLTPVLYTYTVPPLKIAITANPSMPPGTTISAALTSALTSANYSGVGGAAFQIAFSFNLTISDSNWSSWLAGYKLLAKIIPATQITVDTDTNPNSYSDLNDIVTNTYSNPISTSIPLLSSNMAFQIAVQVSDQQGNTTLAYPFAVTTPQQIVAPATIAGMDNSSRNYIIDANLDFCTNNSTSGLTYFTLAGAGVGVMPAAPRYLTWSGGAQSGAIFSKEAITGLTIGNTYTFSVFMSSPSTGTVKCGIVDPGQTGTIGPTFLASVSTPTSGVGFVKSVTWTATQTSVMACLSWAAATTFVITLPQFEKGSVYTGFVNRVAITTGGTIAHGASSTATQAVIDSAGTADPTKLNPLYGSAPHGTMSAATQSVIDNVGTLDITTARTGKALPYANHNAYFKNAIDGGGALRLDQLQGIYTVGTLPRANTHTSITGAIDTSGIATTGAVDFSRGYTNKTLDYLPSGNKYTGLSIAAASGTNVIDNSAFSVLAGPTDSGSIFSRWVITENDASAFVEGNNSPGYSVSVVPSASIPASTTRIFAAVNGSNAVPFSAPCVYGEVFTIGCRNDIFLASGSIPTGLVPGMFLQVAFYNQAGTLISSASSTTFSSVNTSFIASTPLSVTAPLGCAYLHFALVCQIQNTTGSAVAFGSVVPSFIFQDVYCRKNPNYDTEIADGTTYQRMPTANMDVNRRGIIDFTQAHISKTLDNVADGSTYGSLPLVNVSGSGTNKRALIDLSQSHLNRNIDYMTEGTTNKYFSGKTVDNLPDGSTYGRPLVSRLSSGKPLIDFSEAIHLNKNVDNIANTTAGQIRARNLVVNGNNANGTGSPTPDIYGWTGSLSGETISSTGTYVQGSRTYTVMGTPYSANNGRYQVIRVVPGATYTFVGLAYCDNAGGYAQLWIGDSTLSVAQYNGSPTLPIGSVTGLYSSTTLVNSARTNATNTWQTVAGTFTVPSTNADGQAAVLLRCMNAGNAYFAGVQVYQGNRLQDYVDHETMPGSSIVDLGFTGHLNTLPLATKVSGTLPRANTHGDFTSTIATGGGLSDSSQIFKNGIYNSTAYLTDIVLHIDTSNGTSLVFWVDNGTDNTNVTIYRPNNTTLSVGYYGDATTGINAGSMTTTTADTIYAIASYKPNSTAGVMRIYTGNVQQSSNPTGNGWSLYFQKTTNFSVALASALFADAYAIQFTSAGGNTFKGGTAGGSNFKNGGGLTKIY